MSHYHPVYYQTEARIRQAAKENQARRWRMMKQATSANSLPVPEAPSFLDRLRSRLAGLAGGQLTNLPETS